MSIVRRVLVPALVCLQMTSLLASQRPLDEALEDVMRFVRTALQQERISDSTPLQLSVLGHLKQDVISLQVGDITPFPKRKVREVDFFRVEPATFEVVDGTVRSVSVWLDADPEWLVARADDATWYRLYGFQEALPDFNKLVKSLGLEIDSEQSAGDLRTFYVRTVLGPTEFESLVWSDMSLQEVASRDFRERYSADDAMRRYNEWWSKNEAARRRSMADRIEKRGTAFRVEYSRYVKERIERRSLTVNRDGTVSDVR